jgi:SAM-dependent methyltransferase
MPDPVKPDYGIDAPKTVRKLLIRGGLLILLGAAIYYMNADTSPQGGAALLGALGCMGIAMGIGAAIMIWSSRQGKIAVRDHILDALPWRGDERVLDVGCGRGLLLIGAAKRLRTGKATGIDIWSEEDLSNNSADAAIANAKAEGVGDRVKVDTGDARKLNYQPNTFDTVLSSLAIHNIPEPEEREQAIREMVRVLKPGGHMAIFDILRIGDYARVLEGSGMEILERSGLSLLWCLPARWITARKKATTF